MKMKNTTKIIKVSEIIICIIITLIVLVSMVWLISNGKSFSYTIFYEDMVIETIQEVVKKSSLK
jgi:hypothetical protein